MKKIYLLAMMAVGLTFFTACDDDRDSNPVIQQPTTFVLNEPAYASSNIDLESSKEIRLTCSQPDYGYTAAVVYQIQLSLTNSFTVSLAEADAAAEAGETLVADYITLDNSYTNCQITADAAVFSKALMQLAKWEESAVPSTQVVNVRLMATVNNYSIASNVINLNVVPYYIELKDAAPEMWYLIGACIGDGSWSNNIDAVGKAIYPMALVKDFEYDKKTGEGELTFTGYLTPDGFKLIKVPGSWDEQWGSSDGGTTGVMNDGGSSNICVPEAGYYTITLDTKNDKLSIVAASITPTVYDAMYIAGDFNGWAETDNPMTAVNTAVANNHIWSYILDTTGGDTTAKFLQAGWSPNWGGDAFPYGYGVGNGPNISVPAGKYAIVFNDIDGTYAFVALQ